MVDPIIAHLKRRREELGLTGEMVDHLAGFAQGHVAKLENGDKHWGRVPAFPTLHQWCEALGMSVTISAGDVPATTSSFVRTPEQVRMASATRFKLQAA